MGEVLRLALAVGLAGCGFQSGQALAVTGDGGNIDARPDSAIDARPDAPPDAVPDAVPDAAIDAPPPAIGLRQLGNAHNGSNVGSIQVALSMPQLAGDLTVIVVGWYPSNNTPVITDTAGNTYAVAVGPTNTNNEYQTIYYLCGIPAAASNTVTVTFATAIQPDVHVLEYTGIQATSCLDTVGSATGGGTAMDVSTTTTHARDLLVASTFQLNQVSTADPAYTNRGINSFGDLVEDRVVTAAGTYHATATENTSGAWLMQLVSFKGAN